MPKIRNIELCIRCGLPIKGHKKSAWERSPIHNSCKNKISKANEKIFLDDFPFIFNEKELHQVQGMVFECCRCYKLTIPAAHWNKLSPAFSMCVSYYQPGKQPVYQCQSCSSLGPDHEQVLRPASAS